MGQILQLYFGFLFISLYKLKHIYSVEAIECPSTADRFMPKYVGLILYECNVVLICCIIHLRLITQSE
jgi:hypothetical protein